MLAAYANGMCVWYARWHGRVALQDNLALRCSRLDNATPAL